ncbi:hypothetical protein [Actinoplanes sp. HUAS TT8]|uniref:hypothetical protein n=1 Tax=Actinoplanes sp. HUAS TT8 TaxID=3447453 RepID=UPI003F521892
MAGASDNGGWPPDGGSSDELPDLPEEWGVIVIPDDLSELSDEVEAVRAELHLAPPPNGWQRFLRRPAMRRLRKVGTLMLRAPVLIISMAVLVTVASLFASAWPGPARQPATQRTSGTPAPVTTLPALELIGDDGRAVPVNGQLPVVILLTDGCDCDALITETIAAVKPDIAVLAVSRTTPSTVASHSRLSTAQTPRADGKNVRYLRDPTGSLREQLGLTTQDGTAAAILVTNTGDILRKIPHVVSVKTLQPDLERL